MNTSNHDNKGSGTFNTRDSYITHKGKKRKTDILYSTLANSVEIMQFSQRQLQ